MAALLPLNNLGAERFETVVQSLLKAVIGAGTTTFGPGRDGAREATFDGRAPYPSTSEQWSGAWVFQVKFHDLSVVSPERARARVISELDQELHTLLDKYGRVFDNYVLITNVPLSGVHQTGTVDRIATEVLPKYLNRVGQIHVWGAADVSRLLEIHGEVRRPYEDLLTTGDVIQELLQYIARDASDEAITLQAYLLTTLSRDKHAQLDQAGDVSDVGEVEISLEQLFFDLQAQPSGKVEQATRAARKWQAYAAEETSGESTEAAIACAMLSGAIDRAVLIGGPGQGKTTIGQYVAQVHRACLLGRLEEVAVTENYVPLHPRIPFRIILRDFSQWLSENSEGSVTHYLATQVSGAAGREISVVQLDRILASNAVHVVFDGLDEVSDGPAKSVLLRRLSEFMNKCDEVLKADLQVLATTRPQGYSESFDTNKFLHLELTKLSENQVRQYAAKWGSAKVKDPHRRERILEILDECIGDPQIQLLTATPLQVTILLVIFLAGGTPPPQREALFDEYLNVIYKREQAKGKVYIVSERESLVGLHQYLGYILQEAATAPAAARSALDRNEYTSHVRLYLEHQDRFSPESVRLARLKAITVEAGERLVLLVETSANTFGFELRSIQEFFAACHLTDTAKDSEQRYRRFEAIALLPHWRNVSLFFAGRVGAELSGRGGERSASLSPTGLR